MSSPRSGRDTPVHADFKWYTETHDFRTLPLLIRPGSVVAINRQIETPEDEECTGKGLEVVVNGPIEEVVKVNLLSPKSPRRCRKFWR